MLQGHVAALGSRFSSHGSPPCLCVSGQLLSLEAAAHIVTYTPAYPSVFRIHVEIPKYNCQLHPTFLPAPASFALFYNFANQWVRNTIKLPLVACAFLLVRNIIFHILNCHSDVTCCGFPMHICSFLFQVFLILFLIHIKW